MTEEELVIFDILTRPAPELSADQRAEIKKVALEEGMFSLRMAAVEKMKQGFISIDEVFGITSA